MISKTKKAPGGSGRGMSSSGHILALVGGYPPGCPVFLEAL